ncbi:hypothetical protein T492DRAFT_946224 [Pavlovales sp. CCMP2436]|nr:hypothetical protein T492DRAFT_946224 [Pavlovales sp. CCMP2436]
MANWGMGDIPPSHTVYINNLNDELKKEELRTQLYCLFSQYGVVLDVVALKSTKMRGQAFVTFRDIASSTQALHSLQGFAFFAKPMRLQYAKGKANVIAQIEGTYDPLSKHKRKLVEFGVPAGGKKEKAISAPALAVEAREPARSDGAEGEDEGPGAGGEGPVAAAPAAAEEVLPPNKILFVQNLPEQVNEMMLKLLFQQFDQFEEVRLVPGKVGLAFVEFGSDVQAAVAMKSLQAFKVTPTHRMKISFAKA